MFWYVLLFRLVVLLYNVMTIWIYDSFIMLYLFLFCQIISLHTPYVILTISSYDNNCDFDSQGAEILIHDVGFLTLSHSPVYALHILCSFCYGTFYVERNDGYIDSFSWLSFNSLVNIWNKELMDENLFAILSYGPIGEYWGKWPHCPGEDFLHLLHCS